MTHPIHDHPDIIKLKAAQKLVQDVLSDKYRVLAQAELPEHITPENVLGLRAELPHFAGRTEEAEAAANALVGAVRGLTWTYEWSGANVGRFLLQLSAVRPSEGYDAEALAAFWKALPADQRVLRAPHRMGEVDLYGAEDGTVLEDLHGIPQAQTYASIEEALAVHLPRLDREWEAWHGDHE